MASDREIEGTPAEATWAMLTVIIVIVVVVIFFCLRPFFRALEKRDQHWDDLENDPRWDAENFQFSPTSPQVPRDPKYNRLSVCSTENGSSMGTSSSGINRGDSFKNTCIMPRFPDQVEFRLPPSYDDLFSKGPEGEQEDSQPLYSVSNESDTENLIKSQYKEEISLPDKVPQAKKMLRKHQPQASAAAEAVPPSSVQKSTASVQDKKIQKNVSSTQKTTSTNAGLNPVQAKPKTTVKADSLPSTIKTKNSVTSTTPAQPPAPPAKRNSKVITKASPAVSKPSTVEPVPAAPAAPAAPVAPPLKKTYKKIKKTVPADAAVKSE